MTILKAVSFLIGVVTIGILTISIATHYKKQTTNTDLASSISSSTNGMPDVSLFGSRRHLIGKKNLGDLQILDDGTILATLAEPGDDAVVYLTDKKKEWETSHFESNGWRLNAVDFIDTQTGFIVGNYGTIIKTTDGGKTWQELPRFSEFNFTQVKFENLREGYIAGNFGIKDENTDSETWSTRIFRTQDGGNTWQSCYVVEGERNIFKIATLSGDIAVVAIDGTHLIRTEDAGATWEVVNSEMSGVTDIIFTSDSIGWAVGHNGIFKISTDKGKSWQNPDGLPIEFLKYNWWSIAIGQKGKGIAVSEEGRVAFTNDFGKSWEFVSWQNKEALRKARINNSEGVIVGEQNIYKIRIP